MGASDSKLSFKQGVLRLAKEPRIPANDPYWKSFWELPESAEDVFTLFSSGDIRLARDSSLTNIETLLQAITSRLFYLYNHRSFPDPEKAPERDALNCIRVLTRLMPFLYEADLETWRNQFFWSQRKKRASGSAAQDVIFDEGSGKEAQKRDESPKEQYEDRKPLAEELIDTLTDLLFFANFTLPASRIDKSKITYAIWQTGVGCNSAPVSSKEYESNRMEVLRLLLTLTGQAMYMPANNLPTVGVQAISYMVTCPEKQIVLSMLCSLLNTTLNFNPASWRMPYDHMVWKDPKHILVIYSLQLLLALLLYPLPETFPTESKNFYRHYFGRLHRTQDFEFLTEGMLQILNQPIQANSTYLPGSKKPIKSAPETIMLFWEALQCNKRFRAYVLADDRSLNFLVPILFYSMEYRTDTSKLGVVRMCIFIVQTLSTEAAFSKSLNRIFETQDSLPISSKIQGFNGSYADYLIHTTFALMTTSRGQLDSVYPALIATVNNIAAYVENMSSSAAAKLIQLFTSMSSPSFLLSNETNHDLLRSLLEAINAIVEHQYSKNPNFIFAVLKSKKKFEDLRNFTLKSGQQEIERQRSRQKDVSNEQSLSSLSRGGSIDSVRSPVSTTARSPALSNVPENSDAFAIGDDEDSEGEEEEEEEEKPTPSHSSPSQKASRTPSVSSSVDDALPQQLRGMSEKARGKLPAGAQAFSRQGSSTNISAPVTSSSLATGFTPSVAWIESWLPMLPLHTILTLITELSSHLTSTITPSLVRELAHSVAVPGIDPSPIRVHLFEWSTLSLGWYESLLWGLIFTTEIDVSIRGTVGVWKGTAIKLFRVQESMREGPTLMQPRGMVDAVGSSIVNRVTSLNLRSPGAETPNSNTTT